MEEKPKSMEGKPRVLGIVGLLVLGGLLNLWAGYTYLPFADVLGIQVYLILALGVAALVAAVLIWMYKRIGLYIGAVVYGLAIVMNVLSLVSGQAGAAVIGGIVLGAAVLYYIYIYLTREPEKNYFT